MRLLINNVKGFLKNEEAATATEYAVVLGLILVVSIIAMTALGTKVKSIFTSVTSQLPT